MIRGHVAIAATGTPSAASSALRVCEQLLDKHVAPALPGALERVGLSAERVRELMRESGSRADMDAVAAQVSCAQQAMEAKLLAARERRDGRGRRPQLPAHEREQWWALFDRALREAAVIFGVDPAGLVDGDRRRRDPAVVAGRYAVLLLMRGPVEDAQVARALGMSSTWAHTAGRAAQARLRSDEIFAARVCALRRAQGVRKENSKKERKKA